MKKTIFVLAAVSLLVFASVGFAASIKPTTGRVFDAQNPESLIFTLEDVAEVTKISFKVSATGWADYDSGFTYDAASGTLIIDKDFLTFVIILFGDGRHDLRVNDNDSLKAEVTFKGYMSDAARITPDSAEYDVNNPQDLEFTLTDVSEVKFLSFHTAAETGSPEMTTGFSYDKSSGKLTISAEGMLEFAYYQISGPGNYTMRVNGNSQVEAKVMFFDSYPDNGWVPDNSKSSGGGCNSGFAALALLFAIPLFRRKK